ncbi:MULTISPECIES: hypothetical protein [Paraburkholderia]|uniref:hypothetical protein n=1 Tax=Paraburkholderia TaxID=1822464 RepID=UPI00321880A7
MAIDDLKVTVITDANILINFHHIQQLPLLGVLLPYRFSVPLEVVDEIVDEQQRASVRAALAAGHLRTFEIDDLDALALFSELRDSMGRGEAACLAVAATQGHHIASDEKKKFRRTAIELIGEARILRTQDLMLHAIRSRKITVEQADGFKKILATKRYVMAFGSFGEFV